MPEILPVKITGILAEQVKDIYPRERGVVTLHVSIEPLLAYLAVNFYAQIFLEVSYFLSFPF